MVTRRHRYRSPRHRALVTRATAATARTAGSRERRVPRVDAPDLSRARGSLCRDGRALTRETAVIERSRLPGGIVGMRVIRARIAAAWSAAHGRGVIGLSRSGPPMRLPRVQALLALSLGGRPARWRSMEWRAVGVVRPMAFGRWL